MKAFGERHSQTDIICTEGIPVDNRGLQYFKMNSDGTATFGAGVSLRACTEFLRKNNRGLKTTPAYGNITLGGAIGTGAHGSTIKYNASISSQVVSVRIVDGMGKTQDVSNREDLNALKIHLGLLGGYKLPTSVEFKFNNLMTLRYRCENYISFSTIVQNSCS